MGADITFYKDGEEVFYFRDAYNDFNLAWINYLSYWRTADLMDKYPDMRLNLAKAFFLHLSDVKNEEIKRYVKEKNLTKEHEKVLMEKRDMIKNNIKAILDANKVYWSV